MTRQPTVLERARAGDSDACCRVADALIRGRSPKYAEALPWLTKAASEPWAAYHLGLMFDHGWGVKRSVKRALSCYTTAADAGYHSAQLNLGILYANLPGRRQDLSRAIQLYRKAARRGNRNAMFNLGYYYQEGRGLPQSRTRALYWYRKAAELGCRSSKERVRKLSSGGA